MTGVDQAPKLTPRPEVARPPASSASSRSDGRPFGWFQRGSLARRLAVSYALVVLGEAIVFAVTARFFTPLNHPAPHSLQTVQQLQAYQHRLDQSLVRALVLATVISLVGGAIATVVITRLMLDPLSRLRTSARRLREGQYGEQIELPRQPELVDLAADLNLLAARLADIETRRGRLVSDLAHEIRTPLTIVEGQLTGVIDGVYDFSPELLASVREELDRLRRLTEDLSGLSRAEENAYTLSRSEIDLAGLTAGVMDKLRPQFGARDVQLTLVTSGPALVKADPERVTQILTNLLVNSLAATSAAGQVTATVSQRAEDTTVAVSDNGRGIAAADLGRIFDRFERVAPAREKDGAAGSGIGLTIARSLAHAHGGTLQATSPGPGWGATFTLTLPTDSTQEDART